MRDFPPKTLGSAVLIALALGMAVIDYIPEKP